MQRHKSLQSLEAGEFLAKQFARPTEQELLHTTQFLVFPSRIPVDGSRGLEQLAVLANQGSFVPMSVLPPELRNVVAAILFISAEVDVFVDAGNGAAQTTTCSQTNGTSVSTLATNFTLLGTLFQLLEHGSILVCQLGLLSGFVARFGSTRILVALCQLLHEATALARSLCQTLALANSLDEAAGANFGLHASGLANHTTSLSRSAARQGSLANGASLVANFVLKEIGRAHV